MTEESDYQKAKRNGLTEIDRWGDGKPHHPSSVRLYQFLQEHDYKDYEDYFCWKSGGDGDNGETLMYQMDSFFELMDLDRSAGKAADKEYHLRLRSAAIELY